MRVTLEICIPAYKRPNELARCLESIISQPEFSAKRNSAVRVRIYDDAPSAPSKQRIAVLLKKYPLQLVYHFNKKNLGFEKNIQQLLEDADADYVVFSTDDDRFTEGSLARLLAALKKHKPAVLMSAFQLVEGDRNVGTSAAMKQDTVLEANAFSQIAHLFYSSGTLSGICFKTAALDLKGYVRNIGSMYPHMYLFGDAALAGKTVYLCHPLIAHAVGNKVYWEYTDDYMLSAVLKIARELDEKYPGFYRYAAPQVYSMVPYILFSNLKKPRTVLRFLQALHRTGNLIAPGILQGSLLGISRNIREKLKK